MTDQILTVHIRHQNNRAILDLKGNINAASADVLTDAYQEASKGSSSAIVLNFTAVDYINSTGIAVIVSLLAQARQTHRQLIVFGLSDHYLEIFKITRLSDFMTIHTSETEALGA